MRQKSVWVVNHYSPFAAKDGWSGLHVGIATENSDPTWTVNVISASTGHPSGRQASAPRSLVTSFDIGDSAGVWLRSSSYSGNAISRVLNMLTFSLVAATLPLTRWLPKPDAVIGGMVHPLGAMVARQIARRHKVPFILEIGDLWPESLIQLGHLRRESVLARMLSRVESSLIKSAALVMSPLPGVGEYINKFGPRRPEFVWIPNGVPSEALDYVDIQPPRTNKFMYLGSLGNANAVDTIIKAFDRYKIESKDAEATLEIVGSGPLQPALEGLASQMLHASDVSFPGRVPRSQVVKKLGEADFLVANMRDIDLYRFGIGLNKMFDYLLAGRPVIFASNAYNNPVSDASAGLTAEADSVASIAQAMRGMAASSVEERASWGANAREYVLKEFTYERIAQRFTSALTRITNTNEVRDAQQNA